MGNGVEERGAKAFALAGGFGETELLDGASAFDGDGDEGANGFERLAREHRTGNSQAADGADAEAHRDKAEAIGSHRPAALRAMTMAFKNFEVELRYDRTGAIDFLLFGEKQRGGAHFEDVHDLARGWRLRS